MFTSLSIALMLLTLGQSGNAAQCRRPAGMKGKALEGEIIKLLRCPTGYRLPPSVTYKSIMCMENGSWNGSYPKCQSELSLLGKCNAPLNYPKHSQKIEFSEGEIIMIPTCNSRLSPNSANYSSSIVCRSNGKWNGTFPRCASCPPLREGAIFRLDSSGEKATYTCQNGYTSTLRCSKKGKWKGTPINCTLDNSVPRDN